jgi:biopolymer transport protein ExbD
MFRKRYRQQIPELNTTSTADISFMLLIFFLVTSSMDTDKGLLRQLAPPPVENQQPQDVNKDLVIRVELDSNDRLTCDGKEVSLEELQQAVIAMAQVNRMGHVVSVQADRETTYEAYFRMQDCIVGAYHQLRDRYANEHVGRP